MAILGTVFHPKYKLQYFENSNCYSNDDVDSIKEECWEKLLKIKNKNNAISEEHVRLQHDFFFNNRIEFVDLYKYPIIKDAFIIYNTPLASSASVESLFSFAEYLLSPRRGCLSDKNVNNILFLKYNKEL